MNRPSPAQMEWARRLLAHEGAAVSVDEHATTAAARAYDKLHADLAPFVGAAGVRLLLVRSAMLAQGEFACLAEVSIPERSTKLRECLQAQDPDVVTESTTTLFGIFVALLTTLIGARLTTQVLRRAWPTIEEAALEETNT